MNETATTPARRHYYVTINGTPVACANRAEQARHLRETPGAKPCTQSERHKAAKAAAVVPVAEQQEEGGAA